MQTRSHSTSVLATCPVTPTSPKQLAFATIDGSADANDYNLTIRFVGTLTNLFLDTIDFTSGLAMTDMPVLTAAPEGTVLGDWTTRFDKLNAAVGNNCSGTLPNQKFACSKATTGNGPDSQEPTNGSSR